MIRLTWLQFRTQAIVTIGLLIILAIGLAITGHQIAHLYDTYMVNCKAQGDCPAAIEAVMGHDKLLQPLLGLLMLAAPAVIGIFLGAPLVARELESGTYRLAWTQSVSRRRWLFVKLGLIGLASIASGGLLSLMVTWWFRPIDRINLDRFNPGVFDERGIVVLGYAAFAFALGVTAGVLFRRVLPAIAVTLAGFVGVRLAITNWVRPHLMAPAHKILPVSPDTISGVGKTISPLSSGGGPRLIPASTPLPNAWSYSTAIVDKAGKALTSAHLQSLCPHLTNPPIISQGGGGNGKPSTQVINRTPLDQCIAKVATTYHEVVTYQPANRFWTFQSLEMLIFFGLALVLAGFCYWLVRYRVA